jgi:hypothetical protein
VQPNRLEMHAAVMAGQRADRDRRIGRAEWVVPASGSFAGRSAMIARRDQVRVLPWSVAMPSVV